MDQGPARDTRLSYEQQKLAARYVTGLVVSSNKTISGISSIFLKQSSIALNRLVTQYDWDEKAVNAERLGKSRGTTKQDAARTVIKTSCTRLWRCSDRF